MSRSRRSFPPPEDAAARYDAVLRRGRSLRRRRQLVTGAGAGGAVLAVGLAVVLLVGNGSGSSQEVVNDPATTTTTWPDELAAVATFDQDGSTLVVEVRNPRMKQDGTGRQCVTVRVDGTGDTTASGGATDCGGTADGVDTPFTLRTDITCARWMVRDEVSPPPTEPRTDVFEFDVSALPEGSYRAEVMAVSGSADGCEPLDPSLEDIDYDATEFSVDE